MTTSTTRIEWTDATWNPVRGCSLVSPGCHNCYAMKQAHRFSGPGRPYEGLTKLTAAGPQWTGVVRVVESALAVPLGWRTPRSVFVNSMSDLFHPAVPPLFVAAVFGVMAATPQHTYQILTKRPERMRDWFASVAVEALAQNRGTIAEFCQWVATTHSGVDLRAHEATASPVWPLPNVQLLASIESQAYAETRLHELLRTPAVVHGVSAEPLLGPLTLRPWLDAGRCRSRRDGVRCGLARAGHPPVAAREGHRSLASSAEPWFGRASLDWVIVGGESGGRARALEVAWVRRLVQECVEARVPVFVKQLGAHVRDRNDAGFDADQEFDDCGGNRMWPPQHLVDDRIEHDPDGFRDGYQGAPVRIHLLNRKGGDPMEWPSDLRRRERP